MFLGLESKYVVPFSLLGGGAALLWCLYAPGSELPTSMNTDASDTLPLGDADRILREAKNAGYTSTELHYGRGNCSGTGGGPHVSIPKPGTVFKKICFACGDPL